MTDADTLIARLGLSPHPEGGHFRETWRAETPANGRAAGTSIYFLLRAGEASHWHRIDSTEIWHFYAGAPLALELSSGRAAETRTATLGRDIALGHRPQVVVAPGLWQRAVSLGDWTLCGCTVSPGFEFDGFELAPVDWQPTD